jgi:hypothetical protein
LKSEFAFEKEIKMHRDKSCWGWRWTTGLLLALNASGGAASAQPSNVPLAATPPERSGYASDVIVRESFRFFAGGRAISGTDTSATMRMLEGSEATTAVRNLGVGLPPGITVLPGTLTRLRMGEARRLDQPGFAAAPSGKTLALQPLAYNGVPLSMGSDVLTVVAEDGRVLAVRERNIPDQVDGSQPQISVEQATQVALGSATARAASGEIRVTNTALEVFVTPEARGRLAWRVSLSRGSLTAPWGRTLWIAAIGAPDVLADREDIYHDHRGEVSVQVWASSPFGGAVPARLSSARVERNGGGTAVTDGSGGYVVTGGSGSATITASLRGPFSVVDNIPGAEFSATASGGPGDININLNATAETDLSQTSAFFWVNAARTLTAGFLPDNSLADLPTRVNIADSCNAFWDGSSINFFQAGGTCPNTAYADIVFHEFGHGMDAAFGGILNGGLSEGVGDALALIGTRQACVGRDFRGAGTCLRMATDILNWPPGPSEGVHAQGRRYAGFAWSMITGLQAVYQPDQAFQTARALVLGSAAANPANIPDAVRMSFILDDDDGNLATCSQHFQILAAAADSRAIPRPADCHLPPDSCTLGAACAVAPVLHLLLGRQSSLSE